MKVPRRRSLNDAARPGALRGCTRLALLAGAVITSTVFADALLVVRKSEHAVDLVEPGTGARLMSVDVGFTPHDRVELPHVLRDVPDRAFEHNGERMPAVIRIELRRW